MFIIKRPRPNADGEEGQSLAIIVLGMALLLGLVALSIDVGSIVVTRQREQHAADAAVLAGIAVMFEGGSSSQAITEAQNYAKSNGFTSGVQVNVPPASGPNAGKANAIEVIITKSVSPIFSSALGLSPWQLKGRAVGTFVGNSVGFGVITLHPTECESLKVGSSGQIRVSNGGIYVNSQCSSALLGGSSAILTADIISIVGGTSLNGSTVLTPPAKTGQKPIPDPWASLTPPSTSSTGMVDRTPSDCRVRTSKTFLPGLYRCAPLVIDGGTATFSPGNYIFRGGLEVKDGRAVFGRGVYVIDGGGYFMASNTVAQNTDGMLLYNACGSGCGGEDWFHMASSASLTAQPYGAPYANLLIWQKAGNTTSMDFDSSSVISTGSGVGIYGPSATIEYSCGSTVPLQFVAQNVHLGSSARVIVDAKGLSAATVWSFGLAE